MNGTKAASQGKGLRVDKLQGYASIGTAVLTMDNEPLLLAC